MYFLEKSEKIKDGKEIAINSTHSVLKMLFVFIGLARPLFGGLWFLTEPPFYGTMSG